eukprot:NODE_813_length_3989_cov_0.548329.p2 type:complete len:106 gc:universal NODE_813_length_3989_cov_0.548329:3156-3473(+)
MPVEFMPLFLLAIVLGSPGLLILFTNQRFVYLKYMLIYILALPIWNFVLPVYAYWHFDDFSWGQTRAVAGEVKAEKDHGSKQGKFDESCIPLLTWSEWSEIEINK